MTEEKSYCFYDTRFARFTAGALHCFVAICGMGSCLATGA
jgi:hypothetical protein